jgi:hypothetical protein
MEPLRWVIVGQTREPLAVRPDTVKANDLGCTLRAPAVFAETHSLLVSSARGCADGPRESIELVTKPSASRVIERGGTIDRMFSRGARRGGAGARSVAQSADRATRLSGSIFGLNRASRCVEARKAGEKTAAAAISFLEQKGLIVDTGRTKKPRRRADRIARAERFQKRGSIAHEGWKDAQPSQHHSYW